MKTAEEYYNYYASHAIGDYRTRVKSTIKTILTDAQAEIEDRDKRIAELESSQLQPLPEEMPDGFIVKYENSNPVEFYEWFRQRYGTPWWAKLKEGDEISWLGRIKTFKRNRLEMSDGCIHLIDDCRPYTAPTAEEVRKKLSDEEYEVLKRHIKEGGR